MERDKFLQSVRDNLEAAGFSIDDLRQYCIEKKRIKNPAQKFSFEVMYEGMVRSRIPLEGKKPLGVIFENHLITLYDSPNEMDWEEARAYCQSVKITDYSCFAGKIEFWIKLFDGNEKADVKVNALDELLVSLGGESLAYCIRWSASECNSDEAWDWGASLGDWFPRSKDFRYYVRPVLDLSELSH